MKKWNAPVVEEVNVSETAHRFLGNSKDGGYIGDGLISGHLKWELGNTPENPTEPTKPVEPVDPENDHS